MAFRRLSNAIFLRGDSQMPNSQRLLEMNCSFALFQSSPLLWRAEHQIRPCHFQLCKETDGLIHKEIIIKCQGILHGSILQILKTVRANRTAIAASLYNTGITRWMVPDNSNCQLAISYIWIGKRLRLRKLIFA